MILVYFLTLITVSLKKNSRFDYGEFQYKNRSCLGLRAFDLFALVNFKVRRKKTRPLYAKPNETKLL